MYKGDILILPALLIAIFTFVSWLSWHEYFYSEFARNWSRMGAMTYGDQNFVYYSYILALHVFSHYFSTLRFKSTDNKNFGPRKVDVALLIRSIPPKSIRISTYGIFLITAVHIVSLDYEKVMFNTQYLYLSNPLAVAIKNPITLSVQAGHKQIATIAYALLAVSFLAKRYRYAFLLLFPCAWFMAYEVASHSRYAAVFAVAFGGIILFSKSPLGKSVGVLSFLIAYINLYGALSGRGSGAHGLITLLDYPQVVSSALSVNVLALLGNMFEGVYVQGEYFVFGGFNHPDLYKNLSFSPLVSSIDGFAQNAKHMKIGFKSYVPMGATAEALAFKGPYTVAYFAITTMSFLCMSYLFRSGKEVLSIIVFSVFLLATYLQFTYPIRTVLRLFYLSIIIASALKVRNSLARAFPVQSAQTSAKLN